VKVARRVRREATRKRTPPGHLAARPTLPDTGDGFREPGFSKERRLDPQITVGLLTDATGMPLMIDAFEGNRAECDARSHVVSGSR
jgi:hypothetical protein